MTQPRSPQVFISYRHEVESPEHADRVLGLANRLRDEGIDAVLDQYEVSPPAGWPTWCEHEIQRADFVLMVCTEAYHRCIRGDEQPGAAHGVLWEARIIRQMLYDTGSKTTKLIPVLFSNGSPDHIPIAVKGATRYVVDTKQGFEDLYRQLTDQLKTRKPELGTLRKLPERVRQWREPPLAKGQVWAELHNVPELPPHFLPRPDASRWTEEEAAGARTEARSP